MGKALLVYTEGLGQLLVLREKEGDNGGGFQPSMGTFGGFLRATSFSFSTSPLAPGIILLPHSPLYQKGHKRIKALLSPRLLFLPTRSHCAPSLGPGSNRGI